MSLLTWVDRNAPSCLVTDPLTHAARIIWTTETRSVLVTDERGRFVGTVSDRDICIAAYLLGVPLTALRVSSALAQRAACVPVDTTPAAARDVMIQNRVEELPVVDGDGRLLGRVGLYDLPFDVWMDAELSGGSIRDEYAAP